MQYSDKVMEHFSNPRNVGTMDEDDPMVGVGTYGSPACGDVMKLYIKIDEAENIVDVKFKTFGCGAAIAVSSMTSEMAKGKTLEEAVKITPGLVAKELEGLPKNKFHCSNLGAQALTKAIRDYAGKKGIKIQGLKEKGEEEDEEGRPGPGPGPGAGTEKPWGSIPYLIMILTFIISCVTLIVLTVHVC